MPVKNEEGVVIMFILNFEDLAQLIAKSTGRSLHQRLSKSWSKGGCAGAAGERRSALSPGSAWEQTWGLKDAPVSGQDPAREEVCVFARPQLCLLSQTPAGWERAV